MHFRWTEGVLLIIPLHYRKNCTEVVFPFFASSFHREEGQERQFRVLYPSVCRARTPIWVEVLMQLSLHMELHEMRKY